MIEFIKWLLKISNLNEIYRLEKIPSFGNRRSGNTTRLIDYYIQQFFKEGYCKTIDHYNTRQSNERVFYLVLKRLRDEHGITNSVLNLNINNFIIKSV